MASSRSDRSPRRHSGQAAVVDAVGDPLLPPGPRRCSSSPRVAPPPIPRPAVTTSRCRRSPWNRAPCQGGQCLITVYPGFPASRCKSTIRGHLPLVAVAEVIPRRQAGTSRALAMMTRGAHGASGTPPPACPTAPPASRRPRPARRSVTMASKASHDRAGLARAAGPRRVRRDARRPQNRGCFMSIRSAGLLRPALQVGCCHARRESFEVEAS